MKELEPYLNLIEEGIETIPLSNHPDTLYEPMRYFLGLGGKRIRPILTFLAAEMYDLDRQKVLPQALAIEAFHNFTLIHDDIMDMAPLRRGNQTVHEKWGANVAILSGDGLLIKAYELLSQMATDKLPVTLEVFNKMAIEVCEGQQLDIDFETASEVSSESYLEMIRLKTSVLLGCALEFGAIAAGASENDRREINNFGQHIGIAFQIKDDILDLYADPDKFGKQVGGDVLENKKTLLYILATSKATMEQREVLKQLAIESNVTVKINRTKEIFDAVGARLLCEEVMNEHYQLALTSLENISVSKDRKSKLQSLAHFLIVRDL
jgi:geranylgeranyl diphosphate synthase type II